MTLKEKMKRGPVFGMALVLPVLPASLRTSAMSGLDFIYLDLEHTNYMLDEAFEKQIMAANSADISVLVRMADDNEVAIRQVLEGRADGGDPHCKTAEMARPQRGRGQVSHPWAAAAVRLMSVRRALATTTLTEQVHRAAELDTLVIPLWTRTFEFTDNIDEILTCPASTL